jgi:hypothetical protein
MKFLLLLMLPFITPISAFAYCGQKLMVQLNCGSIKRLGFNRAPYQDDMVKSVKLLMVQKSNGAFCSDPGTTSTRTILQIPDPLDADMYYSNGGYGDSSLNLAGETVTFIGVVNNRNHLFDGDIDSKNAQISGSFEVTAKLGVDENAVFTAKVGDRSISSGTMKCVSNSP